MNIRKEARHQSGGNQQRQGYETLMHQEYIRFSARIIADDVTQVPKAQKPSCSTVQPQPWHAHERTVVQRRSKVAPVHKTKYLIMDYDIFRKQVYRRTGGQRDSILKVTDSIQREILSGAGLFNRVLAE